MDKNLKQPFIICLSFLGLSLQMVNTLFADPTDSRFELLSAQFFSVAEYAVLKNDTAYCAFQPGLVIIDFSDPTNPILISETFLNDSPQEVHLLGETAIMLIPNYGLIMIDVSDVQDPFVTSEFLNYPKPISMTVEDSIGFLLYHRIDNNSEDGLVTLDLSIPAEPRILDSVEMEADFAQIAVQDDRAFIAANREGVMVFDIGNPDSLEHVFQYDPYTTEYVTHCIVRDSLVYIGSNVQWWIQILEMNPGDSLTFLSEIRVGIQFSAMTLVQDYIYLSGFMIVDVSDPSDPEIVANLGQNHSARQFILNDDLLYVPSGPFGVKVWNVESPIAPVLIGGYDTPYLNAIDIDVDHAYITRHGDGLYIYSLSEPRNPQLEGYLYQEGLLWDLLVKEDIVYIANGGGGLIILNVSDPSQPELISQYQDSTSYSLGLTLRDSLLFVAEDRYGMKIINITDPYNPSFVSSLEFSIQDEAQGIDLGGNIAYIANERGIIAVDISDPFNPEELAVYNDEENRKYDVLYHNDIIYYADYHASEFYVRDVTDPANSTLLYQGWLGTIIIGEDYFLNFPILFSADHTLNALDIEDPQNPYLFDQFHHSHLSSNLAGNDTLIYSVGNSFVIVDFDRTGLKIDSDLPQLSLPKDFSLSQNHPNPFNPSTSIEFTIPEGNAVQTCLEIFDIRGRLIRVLVNESKHPGHYLIHWDGRDESGREVGSGVFLYRIAAEGFSSTKKMVLLR